MIFKMKKAVFLFLLLTVSSVQLIKSQTPNSVQKSNSYIVKSMTENKHIDRTKYKVVRVYDYCMKFDFMNILDEDMFSFLKGELNLVDDVNKIIFEFGPDVKDAIEDAWKNTAMNKVRELYIARMKNFGPPLSAKPVEELTDDEIDAYNKLCQEYLKADKEYVERIKGFLNELRNAGYRYEADILKRELTRRKRLNKEWNESYPRSIVRVKTEE